MTLERLKIFNNLINSQTNGEARLFFKQIFNHPEFRPFLMTDSKQEIMDIVSPHIRHISGWEKDFNECYLEAVNERELTADEVDSIRKEVHKLKTTADLKTFLATTPAPIIKEQMTEFVDWEYENAVIDTASAKKFRIGNQYIDEVSPFQPASTCILAGLTGSGKTTVALNLVKAFLKNNEGIKILFLESDSETSLNDIKQMSSKIGIVQKFAILQFPRYSDMKTGFMGILDRYKERYSSYPDIVFIDTFEKMNKNSENYALKLNTEAMSYMCQQTGSMFLALSQFSSTVYKSSKQHSQYYPMSIQQGGMDVINNVNTWMSLKRHVEIREIDSAYFNNLYFGKVRSIESSTHLYDKYLQVPFRLSDFNLIFESAVLREDTL
jgi:hypothetical protein